MHKPIKPIYGTTQTLSATSTSASATLSSSGEQVRIVNRGSDDAYFRITSSADTATTTDYYLPANTFTVVTRDQGENTFSYRAETTTAKLLVSTGIGM